MDDLKRSIGSEENLIIAKLKNNAASYLLRDNKVKPLKGLEVSDYGDELQLPSFVSRKQNKSDQKEADDI